MSDGIREDHLHRLIKTLASDEFEGRSPSTLGEELTINFLASEFEKYGATPGNGNSYFQEVPLIAMNGRSTPINIKGEESYQFEYLNDMMAFTERIEDTVSITDSEIVFAGYGIVAPEYDWNDYANLDVEGKTVLVLVNDPGYYTEDPNFFNGRAMTYYGRYTYKYEEAARQGAEAILVIHQTGPAGYPWEVVSGSWSTTRFGLVSPDNNMGRSAVEGWITEAAAIKLFESEGLDFIEVSERAVDPGFEAVSLDQSMSIEVITEFERSVSNNVVALIEGSQRPDEYIIYTAHWDHLGVNKTLEGDQIFNGANDNASGTASLVELARIFSETEPHERSIVMLAVTAEEKGLLGSKYYAENPIYPLENTVANLNMDAMNTFGPTVDIAVVGYGNSELDEYLKKHAETAGRTIKAESSPEKGYYFRSDHFNFAKVGVPALYLDNGIEHTEKGESWMMEEMENYTSNRYHKPADEYTEDMDLRGLTSDLQLYYEIGRDLANNDDWPEWNEGVSFKSIRDKQRK